MTANPNRPSSDEHPVAVLVYDQIRDWCRSLCDEHGLDPADLLRLFLIHGINRMERGPRLWPVAPLPSTATMLRCAPRLHGRLLAVAEREGASVRKTAAAAVLMGVHNPFVCITKASLQEIPPEVRLLSLVKSRRGSPTPLTA